MLQVVEGADWNLEIGALSQLMEETPKNPILLFDKISGYPPGFRVLANHQNSAQKVALVMGIPVELNKLEIAQEIMKGRVAMRNEIVEISSMITEKILREKLDAREHEKLVEKFVKELEKIS